MCFHSGLNMRKQHKAHYFSHSVCSNVPVLNCLLKPPPPPPPCRTSPVCSGCTFTKVVLQLQVEIHSDGPVVYYNMLAISHIWIGLLNYMCSDLGSPQKRCTGGFYFTVCELIGTPDARNGRAQAPKWVFKANSPLKMILWVLWNVTRCSK